MSRIKASWDSFLHTHAKLKKKVAAVMIKIFLQNVNVQFKQNLEESRAETFLNIR